MKLIVGLGNPGKTYEKTRHNAGFIIMDEIMNAYKCDTYKTKFNGLYTEKIIDSEKVLFLKPQKYMNLSGEVIRDFVNFYKIDISEILVIYDDLSFEVGKIKLKKSGTAGGHNGLKNIELLLGTKDYSRIKIGINKPNVLEQKDFVLSKFTSEEYNIIKELSKKCADIVELFIKSDFERAMNIYNRSID